MADNVIYDGLVDKGLSLEEMGKHKDAIECFDKAIEIDEKRPAAWLSKGRTLHTLEEYDDAILCFDKTIERCDNAIDPNSVPSILVGNDMKAEVWVSKAASLWGKGQQKFGSKFQFKPIPATVYPQKKYTANMIFTQAELDFLYAIIECCDKAIEIDEKKLYAWTNKGQTLVLLREHRKAIECYDKAIEIDNRDELSWFSKGYSLGQMGIIEEAKICLSIADKLSEWRRRWHHAKI